MAFVWIAYEDAPRTGGPNKSLNGCLLLRKL